MAMTFHVPALRLQSTDELLSPSLVVVREALDRNIQQMVKIAGSVERLRPHCKTHKMTAVVRLQREQGINKHKCATFAEAEMLASAGVTDIFLAYNLVGPNIARATAFLQKFPQVRLMVTADDATMLEQLSRAVSTLQQTQLTATIGVVLDLDSGLHRTGVSQPERSAALYRQIVQSPGLTAEGFHLYDGHNHQTPWEERKAAVLDGWNFARSLRNDFAKQGLVVPRIVCGGTGSFPVFAELNDPAIELSPGTCVFHDSGYGTAFPEMKFEPALWILTRVISRPAADRLTVDVGNKAVAADPPKGQRIYFPDLPNAEQVLHNEEHLVLQTPDAERFHPGDVLLAVPRHVCPTSALHQWVYVAEGGTVVDRWEVTSRNRQITI